MVGPEQNLIGFPAACWEPCAGLWKRLRPGWKRGEEEDLPFASIPSGATRKGKGPCSVYLGPTNARAEMCSIRTTKTLNCHPKPS